jgi:hypothetical protein
MLVVSWCEVEVAVESVGEVADVEASPGLKNAQVCD